MGVLPFDTLIRLVRFHVYEAIAIDGHDGVDAKYIATCIDDTVQPSFVKMALTQLESAGDLAFFTRSSGLSGTVKTESAFITANGIRAVEKELAKQDSWLAVYQTGGLDAVDIAYVGNALAPASDRIVKYDDNQPAADKARAATSALVAELNTRNDLPEELAEVREVAQAEAQALDAAISKNLIRVATVLALARKILPWIMEKAGSASVGELAKRALSALIDWLT